MRIRRESALNLVLEGSAGSFQVGEGGDGQQSIEVKYFLTHIGLDFGAGGADEGVLSHIAPVREIFNFESLEFDEIMQRDIDDARVSAELIPYLLDERSAGLIKLFPPIIVVVLPTVPGQNKPAPYYPKVETVLLEGGDLGVDNIQAIRSGGVGQEVFQFEQPVVDGIAVEHDLVRLRLNTNRTRLVIVDGQHRAMALLALYRNLMGQWSDERRAPYKEYYAEWTESYIRQFNLAEMNLPVMLCTFPQLNTDYEGDYDLKKAARSVFLTLNKTARKVSDSRNILLDDHDIIAYFLRGTLSDVKSKDVRSPWSFRIHNVELDQFEDRTKLTDPIAITGVNHIYYMIQHLMLNLGERDVDGAKPRGGHFTRRKDLTFYGLMDRLGGREVLGAKTAAATTRDLFTKDSAEELQDVFDERYGQHLISFYEQFQPFEYHNRAVLERRKALEAHEDRKLIPILYEGQGIGKVFERHRENLKEKLKEGYFKHDVPEISAILEKLNATAERIRATVDALQADRLGHYFAGMSDKGQAKNADGDWDETIVKIVNDLYSNIFCTVAFQSGVVCGFFGELEHANAALERDDRISPTDVLPELFTQLNSFCVPSSFAQLKRLIRVFRGELVDVEGGWKVVGSNHTFRDIVYRGEMQPDQWPKYRCLLLEIWKPENEVLAAQVIATRGKCRQQVFSSLYGSIKDRYLREHMTLEDNLEPHEFEAIFSETREAYSKFLKNIGATPLPDAEELRKQLKDHITSSPEDDEAEEEEEVVAAS